MNVYKHDDIYIQANSIKIGEGVKMSGVNVVINGDFEIGDYSKLGACDIRGNHIKIGKHFYHSKGLRVGGGGHKGPNANLTIGDRCVMHNNFINVCEPVNINDDVGLSEEVTILTHGYWNSVLDGYPAKFSGVAIDSGVIVGYRSTILPGVYIARDCVIGANSNVTKSLKIPRGVYGGNPAKYIKGVSHLMEQQQAYKALEIMNAYRDRCDYDELDPVIEFNYPEVRIDDFWVNLLTLKYRGEEDEQTDHFRDFLRRYGIRIYTKRPFG